MSFELLLLLLLPNMESWCWYRKYLTWKKDQSQFGNLAILIKNQALIHCIKIEVRKYIYYLINKENLSREGHPRRKKIHILVGQCSISIMWWKNKPLRNSQFRKRRIHFPKINILTNCMNMKLYNQRLFYESVCVVEVVSQVGASIFL